MKLKQKKHFWDYCRKGQIGIDLIFVVVIILVIAIVVVAGYTAIKQFNSSIQNLDSFSQESKDIVSTVKTKYVGIWDILFLTFLIFMFITMMASAFFIDTHPIFFVISLLMTLITAFVGGHIANSYAYFSETSSISSDASEFTIIPYVFKHYVAIIIIMGMCVTIALYAKIRSSSG